MSGKMKFLKKIFKKKRYVKCTFREVNALDGFIERHKKDDKYIFKIEIERYSNTELSAEGYREGIGYSMMGRYRYFTAVIFSKYYKKIVPLEEAKAEFFKLLITRKKHFESD